MTGGFHDRNHVAALDASVASSLSELDLRTWVVDYLKWITWCSGKETTLLRIDDAALWQGAVRANEDPVVHRYDRGSLRITSRRVVFTGVAAHRSVRLPRIATWSYGLDVISLGAETSESIWHFADLTRAHAFLGAVLLNIADNFTDDESPYLDRTPQSDIDEYIRAFETQEVGPAREQVAKSASAADTARRVTGIE